MKSFTDYMNERFFGMGKTDVDTEYKIKDAMGSQSEIRYKKTKDGWYVKRDSRSEWKKATPDASNAMFDSEIIDAEVRAGSIEKVKS